MMERRSRALVACLVVLAFVAPTVFGQGVGPDVIVGALHATRHWGQVGNMHAYSVGTTSCNIGTEDLLWIAGTNEHPVIAQNLYRLKDGRIEQIGLSWLKHGFVAINNGICGSCNGHLGSVLGVGCSDPYGAGLNGSWSYLGPRFEVNAATGVFRYPFSVFSNPNLLAKRIQVHDDDVNPALNSGALYFVEGQYVTQDDAAAGNNWNNQSYRRVTVSSNRSLSLRDTTQRMIPAIQAWQDHGNGVNQADPDVQVTAVDIPMDGRFWVAAKASDNGNGTWHYEYAIQNITSDRCGGSFRVPLPTGASVSNEGFHDIDYHSGEPWSPTDWNMSIGANAITWSSPQPHKQNPAANALRWGTLYNFWFDTDAAPVSGDAILGLFKPGTPVSVVVTTMVPDPSFGATLPENFNIVRGRLASGVLSDLFFSDDSRFEIFSGPSLGAKEPPVWVELTTTAPVAAPLELRFRLEARTQPGVIRQSIALFNYVSQQFEILDARPATPGDTVVEVVVANNPSRFVNAANREMKVRLQWLPTGPVSGFPWLVGIDQAVWLLRN